MTMLACCCRLLVILLGLVIIVFGCILYAGLLVLFAKVGTQFLVRFAYAPRDSRVMSECS